MKKWFTFELLYKKVNPLTKQEINKILISSQSVYMSNIIEAKEHAIKCFNSEHLKDKLISIRCINY